MSVGLFDVMIVAVEATETEVVPDTTIGLGSVVIALAVVAALIWVAYLLRTGRTATPEPEETPPNQQPFISDDEMESTRLNRVLGAAVISAAVLAIAMPVYYFSEANRQAEAAEKQSERAVHEGERWYTNFSCINCHGPDAGGGAAEFTEPRSQLTTSWSAPSLNDVFYRYSEDEVRFWIVYGRAGTPMPANGLEGGGGMTSQEVDQVIEYLRSLQIPQSEAVAKVEGQVSQALNRVENGALTVTDLINGTATTDGQEQAIADVLAAPSLYAAIETTPTEIRAVFTDRATCTPDSAALVDTSCSARNLDTDRDGLSDDAERALNALYGGAALALDRPDLAIELLTDNAFSTEDAGGTKIADLVEAEALLRELDTLHLQLGVVRDRQDVFLAAAEAGKVYLEAALAEAAWAVDFDALAAQAFGGDVDMAMRAVGLFNAYCARCHTAGYSAGVAYQQQEGSGAWAPSLIDGRSVVQFPTEDQHVDFIIKGSNLAEKYGVNGIGRGWMPGFGQILSREDIMLIVQYERAL